MKGRGLEMVEREDCLVLVLVLVVSGNKVIAV